MFRDDLQLAHACRALLGTVRLERLWDDNGPTLEASELLENKGAPLPLVERTVVLAAWTFWNRSGGLTLDDVVEHLDGDRAEPLCFLVMAMKYGADAIDDWLAEHALERRTR
jgi:hypothetical protein